MTPEEKAARLQRLNGVMDYITKHFAVVSVLVAVIGASLAIIFIAAYLRVFDWRIIWIIEYADILKIGLIVVAVFSGFSYYIWSAAKDAINLANEKGKSWAAVWSFGILLWCLSLGYFLWQDYHSPEPYWGLHIQMHMAIIALIGLWLTAINFSRDFPNLNGTQIAWAVFLTVGNISILGSAFGFWTRDSGGFFHDVYLKDNKELRDVGLVLLTSHHVVLYTKDKTVVTVPSGDVTRLEKRKEVVK
jgi:hypothetical protein